MSESRKDICPRLLDYLVLVGARHPGRPTVPTNGRRPDGPVNGNPVNASGGFVQAPELLRRYPQDNHKDFELPPDVTYFCQPEGSITIGSRHMTFRDTTSFVFTLTEKDSAKQRFGVCLNFYRPCDLYDETAGKRKRTSNQLRSRTLTSLCLISHHPFFSSFREALVLLRTLINACNQRVVNSLSTKATGAGRLGREPIWSALLGSFAEIPGVLMHEIKELEIWILRLLSAPVPVPSKTRLELQLLPPHLMEPMVFALPDRTRFSLVDFPLHLPLELLGVDSVVKLLTCVMLEYKVVLQSRDYNALSMCVLSLVNMLYPLEYMFPVIPLLPAYMADAEQLLLAPTPFLIGVPASFFHHRGITRLPPDVVLADLDANRVLLPDGLEFPEIPEPENSRLQDHFRQALSSLTSPGPMVPTEGLAELSESEAAAAYGQANDVDAVDVATRVAMVRFFCSQNVLQNFTDHTRTLRLHPRPVVALQVDSFLRSRPVKTPFIQQLSRTQAVEYFAEWSLRPKNETFLRIQNGIISPGQIGDKVKWYTGLLQPIQFCVCTDSSTLPSAYELAAVHQEREQLTDQSGESGSEEEGRVERTGSGDSNSSSSLSSITDLVFQTPQINFDPLANFCQQAYPLSQIEDVYRAPMVLELPDDLASSVANSVPSSVPSSPGSSISTAGIDSENDFAKIIENLVVTGFGSDDAFDHNSTETIESPSNEPTPRSHRRPSPLLQQRSDSSESTPKPEQKTPTQKFNFKIGDKRIGDHLNGYADKSQNVLSEVIHITTPAAQKLMDKTPNPFPLARKSMERSSLLRNQTQQPQNQHPVPPPATATTPIERQHRQEIKEMNEQRRERQRVEQEVANKNQQAVKELCDAVVTGNGVSVFSLPKLRKLMEDEMCRQLACVKLNHGLERRYTTETEFLEEVNIPKTVWKGVFRVLQAAVQGLEHTYFNSSAGGSMSSVFFALEIAHTHYWSRTIGSSPINDASPSVSISDLTNFGKSALDSFHRAFDQGPAGTERSKSTPQQPAPRPQRPPPPRQESIIERSKLANLSSTPSSASSTDVEVATITGASVTPPQAPADAQVPPPPQKLQAPQTLAVTPAAGAETEELQRFYVYQELFSAHHSSLWSRLQFWEDAFYDVVALEREVLGLDQDPQEMLQRYSSLSEADRRRLEADEDRLLVTLLHNLTACMTLTGVPRQATAQKVRRLLGKCHVSLQHSKQINDLLDTLPSLSAPNALRLRPLCSRLMHRQSFTVHVGTDSMAEMKFLEISDDAIVIRGVDGSINERWWYEQLVNMTYSPKAKVLCVWRKSNDHVQLHKFYTKKCRDLYTCVKKSMEKAAERGKGAMPEKQLGGEFPVQDTVTNQCGLLQVKIDGIALTFEDKRHFIDLINIKKCNSQHGNIFVLEEFDRATRQLNQRRYVSTMADQICYAVLCVFSYVAAHGSNVLADTAK